MSHQTSIVEFQFTSASTAETTEAASLVCRFIGLYVIILRMSVLQTGATDSLLNSTLTPYAKFEIALKSKEVQRQYPNLLLKFLVFCNFGGSSIEKKQYPYPAHYSRFCK